MNIARNLVLIAQLILRDRLETANVRIESDPRGGAGSGAALNWRDAPHATIPKASEKSSISLSLFLFLSSPPAVFPALFALLRNVIDAS